MAIGTRTTALLGAFAIAFVPLTAASAQDSTEELRQEIEALKQGQKQIRSDLAEIKRLLQQRPQRQAPAGPDVKDKVFDLGANPIIGEQTAKLTLVEFTDYQ